MRFNVVLTTTICLVLLLPSLGSGAEDIQWTDQEKRLIASMQLDKLPPLPDDPSNDVDTDPAAARFGEKVFHDARFSANDKISCATCHPEDKSFQDGRPVAVGVGRVTRRTMPLIAVAYNDWFFWDGRKDTLWSQTLAPIENPREHGISRTRCVELIRSQYRDEYEAVFGPLPKLPANLPSIAMPVEFDQDALDAWRELDPAVRDTINTIFANTGKALAAYVRVILPSEAPFDRFAADLAAGNEDQADGHLSPKQQAGLKLFIGEAGCFDCHFGPRMTNDGFHDTGVNEAFGPEFDAGRAKGITQVQHDMFNCMGDYSDAEPKECSELRFMDTNQDKYRQAFKTPTLRNVAVRPPYMHAGQIKTLEEVIDFYAKESETNPELTHADLTEEEKDALIAFMESLTSDVTPRMDEVLNSQ